MLAINIIYLELDTLKPIGREPLYLNAVCLYNAATLAKQSAWNIFLLCFNEILLRVLVSR